MVKGREGGRERKGMREVRRIEEGGNKIGPGGGTR